VDDLYPGYSAGSVYLHKGGTLKTLRIVLLIGILASAVVPAFALTHTAEGYLGGPDDYDEFDLFARTDYIEVVFTWPESADFWVTVYGMNGDLLGDFRLADGEIIQLSGGGKFTLLITAESGGGNWWCEWEDADY
jgi:hypothetical protein